MSLDAIRWRVCDAACRDKFDEVLRWKGRIEELVKGQDQKIIYVLLKSFALGFERTEKFDKARLLWERCAESCGASKRFSEQVQALTAVAECYVQEDDFKKAAVWLENARDVSKEHGFVSMESKSCSRLADFFLVAGRISDGVEQHRRAFRVAKRVGKNDASHDRASLEQRALRGLVEALCQRDGHLEEAEALFTRLREGGDNTADCRLWNHYLRGIFHAVGQNGEAAADAFRAAVAVAEKHPEVLQDGAAACALANAKDRLEGCGVGASDAPPVVSVFVESVVAMVQKAMQARDWPGVLRWESRLEELLTLPEPAHPLVIDAFACANSNQGHSSKAASLFQRLVQFFGKLERFTEEGRAMCRVGQCFLSLDDVKSAKTWYQNARKLAEKHGCYIVECSATLGLGRVELHHLERMPEAEELLRHALSVLDYVEGGDRALESDIKHDLATLLLQTDRHEEAGPLIQRLRELAKRAGALPDETVRALKLAVDFQVLRGDNAQAWTEIQVLSSEPISTPPPRDSRKSDPISHLRHQP